MEILRKDPRFLTVSKLCEKLWSQGYQALLAGGCVRDGLLGVTPHDFDIATNATPDQVEALFEKTVAVGKSFGVIVVVTDGQEIEIATFRKDGGYQDGRRPDSVDFSSADEDAKRRDFTINGLFYDIAKDKVIDYVEGVSDLQKKQIVAIGDPEKRFAEDHLRLLRAIRFTSQLDFQIESKTMVAIQKMQASVNTVSKERVHQELLKLMQGKASLMALKILFDSGVLQSLLEDEKLKWVDPRSYFEPSVQEAEQLWSLWWLWIQEMRQRPFTVAELDSVLIEFRLSRQQMSFVKKTVGLSQDYKAIGKSSLGVILNKLQDSAFRFTFNRFQASWKIVPLDLWQQVQVKLKQYEVSFPKPVLQASDLPVSVKGAAIGAALQLAYEAQLEDKVTDKESALKLVLESNGSAG